MKNTTVVRTTIRRCTCTHAYQDALYGRSLRVHNAKKSKEGKENGGWRCTVCGRETTT